MSSASILVVDDESVIRSTIRDILTDEGYAVETAADAGEAWNFYRNAAPDLVLLDIWMPDMDGITLLKQWSADGDLKCPIIVMSGHGTVETAVEATRLGALDFIEKPLSLSQLLSTVEMALAQRRDSSPPPVPHRSAQANVEVPQGKSRVIADAREQAQEIARQNVPTLFTGEAGSGRDMFARYVHSLSDRAAQPFIFVSGASLTDDNVVDMLVGTTGRAKGEPGLLQQAEGGVLFINDLQELSARAQSLLLSIIEQGAYTRPGKVKQEPADVRLMASVQRYSGDRLRADLLAALGVMQLSVPALRDYSEDVPALLRSHVDALVLAESLTYRRFSVAAQNRLRNYPWPGNLCELKNLIRRLLISGKSPEIGLEELEACLEPPLSNSEPLVKQDILALPMREAREQFERTYLRQQLALCGGKVGKLAERVGMERTHLYRKLRALDIDFRQGGDD